MHDIAVQDVFALTDDILVVTFEDRTLGMYDTELLCNRIPGFRPISAPESMHIVRDDPRKYAAQWAAEIGCARSAGTDLSAVPLRLEPTMRLVVDAWCAARHITAEQAFLAFDRFVCDPANREAAERLREAIAAMKRRLNEQFNDKAHADEV